MTCCTQSHCPQRRLRFGGDRQGASKTFRAVPPENRPVLQKVYRRPVMRRQEPAERSRHICGTSLESSMLLKATLTQTAWAGSNKKNSAFQFRYQRLKTRRGVKRATIAVAHAQLIALYWVLRNGVPYHLNYAQLSGIGKAERKQTTW